MNLGFYEVFLGKTGWGVLGRGARVALDVCGAQPRTWQYLLAQNCGDVGVCVQTPACLPTRAPAPGRPPRCARGKLFPDPSK